MFDKFTLNYREFFIKKSLRRVSRHIIFEVGKPFLEYKKKVMRPYQKYLTFIVLSSTNEKHDVSFLILLNFFNIDVGDTLDITLSISKINISDN